jgi:hypothetical protein
LGRKVAAIVVKGTVSWCINFIEGLQNRTWTFCDLY